MRLSKRPDLTQWKPTETGWSPADRIEHIPYSAQQPHSGKQTEFLKLDCREALYGGAGGGGKSSALLMAALQYVDVPGYSALLLRRTYADLALPGALMNRAEEWLRGTNAKWNQTEKTWTFPSGATVTFGYMKNDAERFRYQGSELQFVGFDELTQFSEVQYRYLFSRLRRLKGVRVPLRVRGGTNPGGFGHEWVKSRFQIPKERPDGIWQVPGSTRVWVPALLDDNPSLDHEEYIESLNELDPVTRAQMLAGDWEIVFEGELFRRAWFPIKDAVPAAGRAVRFWDLAATEKKAGNDPDWTVGVKLLLLPDQAFFVADVQRVRATPGDVKKLILQTAQLDGRGCGVWVEQEPGSTGVAFVADFVKALAGYDVHGLRSTGSKITRAKPVSAQAEAGNIAILNASWADVFLQELVLFPQEGVHDDQVDALSGAFAALTQEEEANPLWGMSVAQGVSGWQPR
jgi:predicted phage terminase large subunit-like protein